MREKSFDPVFSGSIQEIFGTKSLELRQINAAFYKNYRGLVLHALKKKNKYTKNFEDLEAKLWMDFMGSASDISLVEKFFEQAEDVIPDTMTTQEACKYLGIQPIPFKIGVKKHLRKASLGEETFQWMPTPKEGDPLEESTTYSTSQIIALAAHLAYVKRGSGIGYIIPPEPTKQHFVNYLRRCIVNRFANFCRTESRKHQERVWDTFPDQRSFQEDPAPWEDRQESRSCQEEDAEMGILVRKLLKTAAGAHLEPLFLSVDQGLSFAEALDLCVGISELEKQDILKLTQDHSRSVAA